MIINSYENCAFSGRERSALATDPLCSYNAVSTYVNGKGMTLYDLRMPLPMDFLFDVSLNHYYVFNKIHSFFFSYSFIKIQFATYTIWTIVGHSIKLDRNHYYHYHQMALSKLVQSMGDFCINSISIIQLIRLLPHRNRSVHPPMMDSHRHYWPVVQSYQVLLPLLVAIHRQNRIPPNRRL